MKSSSALLASLCLTLLFGAACGGGTIVFPGDDDDDDNDAKVTFKGNIDDVSPVSTRDIVVFVYEIDDDSDECPCPGDPSASGVGKAAVLENGETDFTISDLDSGAFGVIFLLDEPGDDADGQIDPGDEIAILDDVDCELDDVEGNRTVTLEDIDISFSSAPTADCTGLGDDAPGQGRARADLIRQAITTGGSGDEE